MPYKIRTVVCNKCGSHMRGRYKPLPPWYCFKCGMERMAENIRTMHERSGAAYERSVAAGQSVGRQIAEREGVLYERWKMGMRVAAQRYQ